MIVRPRPIAVEPQAIRIVLAVEHVRIAIGVWYVPTII